MQEPQARRAGSDRPPSARVSAGGGGWGDGLPGAGSSGRVGGTPAAAALGSSASAQRLGSLSGSQALLLLGRSGSQTTRSQQLPGEGGHLERRAVHTLQAVTRLKASALPPGELRFGGESLGLGWCGCCCWGGWGGIAGVGQSNQGHGDSTGWSAEEG